jgi:hypothetical protein
VFSAEQLATILAASWPWLPSIAAVHRALTRLKHGEAAHGPAPARRAAHGPAANGTAAVGQAFAPS